MKKYKGIWFFNYLIYVRPFLGFLLLILAFFSSDDLSVYSLIIIILQSIIFLLHISQLLKVYYNKKDAYSFIKMVLYIELFADVIDFIITTGNSSGAYVAGRCLGFAAWYFIVFNYLKRRKINEYLIDKGKNNRAKKENDVKIINNKLYVCDNCGASVSETADKCPDCGLVFEEEKEVIKDKNITDKYDELIKLKELLDKKIITNEEFEKEKRKILNIKE